ncbi:MAG: peptidylprolyl isomerase, partial [Deltaproteobacteria bacterium]|nr:peptidylprolyl isomerase [Deltaproteobacteria bacterium]
VSPLPYKRGTVGMALAGKDTGGSQFFVALSRQPHLDGNYTVFGDVIGGMDVVDLLEEGDAIETISVQVEEAE